jgi:hypothetical protein
MQARVVVVALVALLAGCGTIAGVGDSPDTVTPAPVPTAATPSEGAGYTLPPGVDTTGVTAVDRLARAHAAAAADTRHVWRRSMSATHWFGNSSVNSSTTAVVRFHNGSSYHRRVDRHEAVIDDELRYLEDYEEYVTGAVAYRSWTTDGEREVRRTRTAELTPGYPSIAATDVQRYLDLESARVSRVNASDGTYYEVVGTRSMLPRFGRLDSYHARARVRADGFVTHLDVRFNASLGDERVRGQFNFTSRQVGTATVPEPGWVPQTGEGSRTATAVNRSDADTGD